MTKQLFFAARLTATAFWILAAAAAPAGAATRASGEVGLKLDVDKAELAVGDSLTLSIEFKQVTGGDGIQATEPSIATPDHFDLRGNRTSTQIVSSNGHLYEVVDTKYTLVADQEGIVTIGPANVIYQDAQGQRHELHSNTVRVTVTAKPAFSLFGHPSPATPSPTPTGSDDGLQGVKPIPTHYGFLIVLFWLMVLLVAAGFAYRLWKRRHRPTARTAPLEGDRRREELKRIFNEDLPSQELCLKLSAWARECLGERYGFPAEDCTTGEVLRALGRAKASAEVREAAEKCLRACDRVLYAEGALSPKESLRGWAQALLPRAAKRP